MCTFNESDFVRVLSFYFYRTLPFRCILVLPLHDYVSCFVFIKIVNVLCYAYLVVQLCCKFPLLNDMFDLPAINCLVTVLHYFLVIFVLFWFTGRKQYWWRGSVRWI